jgi:hypothetical protein
VYDQGTGQLTLPWVDLGGVAYRNVVVRVDAMSVLGVGGATALSTLLTTTNQGTWTGYNVYPAAQSTYDAALRELTLPQVALGQTVYRNVTIRLESFALLSSGMPTTATCTPEMFTQAAYGQIARGMTVEDVTAIIGCAPTRTTASRDMQTLEESYNYWWLTPGESSGLNAGFQAATNATPLSGDFKGYFGLH